MTLASSGIVHLSLQTRIVALGLALLFIALILELIRRRSLQERYTVVWLLAGMAMLAGVIFPDLIEILAGLLGVRDTNAALFSLALLMLLGLTLNLTVVISRQSEQITRLAQEAAITNSEKPSQPLSDGSEFLHWESDEDDSSV